MLCKGDIDSQGSYEKYKHLLEDDLLNNTYVTKTRKPYGYHFDWLEPWKEDNDFVSINHGDCKSEDTLFEIMVGLQYTQVAGRHREDSTFYYENVGCRNLKELGIMVRSGFYNKQTDEIFNDLLLNPNEIKTRRKHQQRTKDPFHRGIAERERTQSQDNVGNKHVQFIKILDDWQIDSISSWAGKFYGVNGHSYHFMRSLLGTLACRIAEESGIEIIDRIIDDKDDLQNRSKWYGLLRDAYQDVQDGLHVEGIPTLIKAIERNISCDEKKATKHVDHLLQLLRKGGVEGDEKKDQELVGKSNFDLSKIPNKNSIGYVINIVQRTVKQDLSLVKLITCTALSAYSDDPINLAILGPTSEGKTHPVEQTINTFPIEDVLKVGSMTPKVIIRQDYTLVDENNESIQGHIDDLKKRIRECKDDKSRRDELNASEDKLQDFLKNARCLIDLRNKIYVLLEPPHHEMWNILKPILSHDSDYITHNYVYEVPGTGFRVKKIVTKGWPAFIVCSAKNQANWPEWSEIASRCIVTAHRWKCRYQFWNQFPHFIISRPSLS